MRLVRLITILILGLFIFSGCNFLSFRSDATKDKFTRSCGKLNTTEPTDPNYQAVFNCMTERVLSCIPSEYEVLNQFDFKVVGLEEDGQTCKFNMTYKPLALMQKYAPEHMYEYAGLSKTCKMKLTEIASFEALLPVNSERFNIFKSVFFELSFGILNRCEGSLVDKFKNGEK